ncbi:TetR/AcrR family transcriptional regulator [Brevundimonas subvibrioides]|uniref:TetR/AcrR family transcriptional regulator n=1 Tax=Brevundimonas subvibrioides TaxID=74313 RepID=UPI0022B3F912|nr:TetR/AcrR family transcriptional regulator [Brevundimonas subvibrioides]
MPSASKLTGTKRERTLDQILVSAQGILMEDGVASLGVRQITTQAGLVSATFYNYFRDIEALISELGDLLGATHAAAIMGLIDGEGDPAARFARITRQTLRVMALRPGFGRLMFDVGLYPEQLGGAMRLRLKRDIADGIERGLFKQGELDVIVSMVAGAIEGLGRDLHRGTVPASRIDTATATLLNHLGLTAVAATALGHEAIAFPPLPDLPMRWLALPPTLRAERYGNPP